MLASFDHNVEWFWVALDNAGLSLNLLKIFFQHCAKFDEYACQLGFLWRFQFSGFSGSDS